MSFSGPSRILITTLAIVSLVIGTVGLGLGLSVFNYLRYEEHHAHPVPDSVVRECFTLFAGGALFCLVGTILWILRARGTPL